MTDIPACASAPVVAARSPGRSWARTDTRRAPAMSAGAHQTRTSLVESGGWHRATSPAITSGDSPRSHSSGASSRSSSLSSAGTRLKARTPLTSSMLATPPRYGPAVSPRFPVSDDGLNGLLVGPSGESDEFAVSGVGGGSRTIATPLLRTTLRVAVVRPSYNRRRASARGSLRGERRHQHRLSVFRRRTARSHFRGGHDVPPRLFLAG